MTKLIAAQGCEIELTPPSGTGTPVILITNLPSLDVKAEGKGLYSDKLTITITGYNGGAAGAGTISGTAQNVKIDGKAAVLEGDMSTEPVTLSDPTTGMQYQVTLRVKSAGQNSVKGA